MSYTLTLEYPESLPDALPCRSKGLTICCEEFKSLRAPTGTG